MAGETSSQSVHAAQAAFRVHLAKASQIVQAWPQWKQSVLGGSENTQPKHVAGQTQRSSVK